MLITSACDWSLSKTYPFKAAFLVNFENATIEMNGSGMTVYPEDGDSFTLAIEPGNAYLNEVDDFINCINENRESTINTPQSVMQTTKLAIAEKESAEKGIVVTL